MYGAGGEGSLQSQTLAAHRAERKKMLAIVRPALRDALDLKQSLQHASSVVAVLKQFGGMDELPLIDRILEECPGIVDAAKFRAAVTDIKARMHFRPSPATAFCFLCFHHFHERCDYRGGPFVFSNRLDITPREAPKHVRDPYSLPRVQESIGVRFLRTVSTVMGAVFHVQHAPDSCPIVRGDDFDTRIEAALIQRLFQKADAVAPVMRVTRWWRRLFLHPPPPKPDPEHFTLAFALLARDFRNWLITVHDGEFHIADVQMGTHQEGGVTIRYREEEGTADGIIECVRGVRAVR